MPYLSERGYNGWANWDTWYVALLMQNDESLNRNWGAWAKNFYQKEKRGVYDPVKAAYAVRKYIVPQAQKEERKLAGGPAEPGDVRIDPKEVDTAEIAQVLLEQGRENAKYDTKVKAEASVQRE